MSESPPDRPSTFWRDPRLPFVEARQVDDGRRVCYDKHTHETYSIGAITGGRSHYLNGARRWTVQRGAVVAMNPGEVHACNPLADEPWAYRMLYVDAAWLADLQRPQGHSRGRELQALPMALSEEPALYAGLNRLYRTLTDPAAELLRKQTVAIEFFADLLHRQPGATITSAQAHAADPRLQRALDYIAAHYRDAVRIEDLCAATGLSSSYLIRAFRSRYGMTPHRYLIDRRIRAGRELLRRGESIADAAAATGFADQAHFQREFKRRVAATPGQYRA
ncbi:AraC family transcriptional regulator [Pseudomonas sp. CGJS7]|uniref:AraC family transcriptional regulator n=1 Tax=Pseudomonas sp. CGJS7 TaxID=3109348 RepID=UPI003009ACEC